MNSIVSLDGPGDVLSQGYDEQFDPPAPDAYECPICLLILCDPVQTECGHRFCRGCVLKVVRERRPNCPIDNETLSEDLMFRDNFARREILGLNVHCRNYRTHGCPWLKSLKDLPAHMESCEFSVIRCPNNCGEELQQEKIQYNLDEECVRRIVVCPYCGLKVMFQKQNEHYGGCMQFWTHPHNRMESDGTSDIDRINFLNAPKDKRDDGYYDEQFDPPPPDCYLCSICQKVPKIPMQAECGHMFCKRCTLKAIGEGRPNCPIDNETLSSENLIYRDNSMRREILGLNVHCRNYKTHGCPWLKSLKDLPSHMESCEFSVIRCPNNCGEELQRKNLKHHLDEECVRRIVACPYCDLKVAYRTLTSHMESCDFTVIRCPNNCGTEFQRKELQYHMDKECIQHFVVCVYCDLKVVHRILTEHCEESPLRTTECPYACGGEFVWEELAIHCESGCSNMKRKCHFRKCNFQGTQIEIEEHDKMHEHRDIESSDQCSSSG